MPGTSKCLNQQFKMKKSCLRESQIFRKIYDAPLIHQENYFNFKIFVKVLRNTRHLCVPEIRNKIILFNEILLLFFSDSESGKIFAKIFAY